MSNVIKLEFATKEAKLAAQKVGAVDFTANCQLGDYDLSSVTEFLPNDSGRKLHYKGRMEHANGTVYPALYLTPWALFCLLTDTPMDDKITAIEMDIAQTLLVSVVQDGKNKKLVIRKVEAAGKTPAKGKAKP